MSISSASELFEATNLPVNVNTGLRAGFNLPDPPLNPVPSLSKSSVKLRRGAEVGLSFLLCDSESGYGEKNYQMGKRRDKKTHD